MITGGAGFIGSHLAEKYLEMGYQVYIIDNLSTGSLNNIKHIQNATQYKDRFHVTIDTIFNEEKMTELIGTCGVVIHLAAAVGVKYILDNPFSSIQANIMGTEVVLRLCNKFQKKVMIASTSEVPWKTRPSTIIRRRRHYFWFKWKRRWSYAASKLATNLSH